MAPVWFWIWTALVLGAAVTAFFVWRDAWRRFRRAGTEVSVSAGRLGRVWERAAERTEERLALSPSTAPTVTTPRAELRAQVDGLRQERLARKAWRRRPRPEVWERWRGVWR